MKRAALLWCAAPLVTAFIAVSFANAQNVTLSTFLKVDNNNSYNNHVVWSCVHTSAYWQAHAQALDNCGNVKANLTQSVIGATVSTRFYANTTTNCAPAAKHHRVDVEWHNMDPSTGTETIALVNDYAADSGCWNTDINAGKCLGQAGARVWGWVDGAQSNVCDNVYLSTPNYHNIAAYSLGSTP